MPDEPAKGPALSATSRLRLVALTSATLAASAGLGALIFAGTGERQLGILVVATVLALGAAGVFLVLRAARAEAVVRWSLDMNEAANSIDGDAVAMESSDGRVVFCNDPFVRLAPDTGDGVMGRIAGVLGGRPEEVRAQLLAMRNLADAGGALNQEFAEDAGTDGCYSVGVRRIAGGRYVWRLRDVSAARSLRLAAEAQANLLSRQVDALPVGLYACTQDGRLVFANETFAHWVAKEVAALRTGELRLSEVVEIEDAEGGRTFKPRGCRAGNAVHGGSIHGA